MIVKEHVVRTCVHFSHWSRRKTAILESFHRTIKICTLCLAYGLISKSIDATAQSDNTEVYAPAMELEEIEVKGKGNAVVLSGISRITTLVQPSELDPAGIRNFADILEYAANIDVRQRGSEGIQSDLSIRGGSFDQVLVLLNGITLNDPQTGHVSLDLPVDMEIVERIEVLQGPAARTFGPSASTGALNIITREPVGTIVSASYATGSYGYMKAQAAAGFSGGIGKGLLSLSHARSNGYAENTDFSMQNAYYRHRVEKDIISLDLQTGYQHKRFGANGFYSPSFPDQMEEADVFLGSLKAETGGRIRVIPVFYWKQRRDHFILVRGKPEFYQNFHRTNVAGSQLKLIYEAGRWNYANAIDLRSEHIISNNLGAEAAVPVKIRGEDGLYYDREYGRTSLSWSQGISFRNASLDVEGGIMLYWSTAYPGKPGLFPGIDISYRIFRTARLYASYNRSGSMPTFTDLFYKDPENQGNQELDPARIRSFEAGIRYAGSHSAGSIGYFRSLGHDVINWLWSWSQSRFKPVNLPRYDVSGIQAEYHTDFSGLSPDVKVLKDLTIGYMWMQTGKSMVDSVSKYDNLRHKFFLVLNHRLFGETALAWRISYQDRTGGYISYDSGNNEYAFHSFEPFILVDVQIAYERKGFSAFAELSNLFDVRYVDAGSLQQPGRWFKAGVRVSVGP